MNQIWLEGNNTTLFGMMNLTRELNIINLSGSIFIPMGMVNGLVLVYWYVYSTFLTCTYYYSTLL